jgi:SHS2 domain-containing protein
VPFTVLSHTADTGIEATAASLAGLVGELAAGMFSLVAQPDPCLPDQRLEFEITAPSPQELVVDVLAELLYQAEVTDVVPCEVAVESGIRPLDVIVRAGAVSSGSVDLVGPPIKAVTYHDLVVRESEDGWYGRVYLDV